MIEQIFYQNKDGIYRGENAEGVLSYLLEEVEYLAGRKRKVCRYQISNDYRGALGYYYDEESKQWCAFDNASGECFVETFNSAEEADKWVNKVEEDEEIDLPTSDFTVDKSNDCKRCDDWRSFFSDRNSDTYCPDCGNLIIYSSVESPINLAEYWWSYIASPEDYEVVSGLYEFDFSPDNDGEEFIDACNTIWRLKTDDQKIAIWKTINNIED